MFELLKSLFTIIDENKAFYMVTGYVNNKKYSSEPYEPENCIEHVLPSGTKYYEYIHEIDISNQIEYANPDTVTLTYEGPLYNDINYGNQIIYRKLEQEVEKHNMYIEQGYSWSFSCYKI